MEQIAIISDIHGNLEALKTVLNDIKERNINHVFCLGDVVLKGANQEECLRLVKECCEVIIKGNCEALLSGEIHKSSGGDDNPWIAWNKSKLSKEFYI